MGPGVGGNAAGGAWRSPRLRSERRNNLLGEQKKLAGAGDVGPIAVEVGHQPLQVIAIHRPVKRGLIGELVGGLMQRGIADAPETPGLFDAERLRRVGRMFLPVPPAELPPLAGS